MKYPYAVTQKCPNCGRTFTCRGLGWKRLKTTGKCPYANDGCFCEKCHRGESRGKGCEEVKAEETKEQVQFT
jgi:hypothetical protein